MREKWNMDVRFHKDSPIQLEELSKKELNKIKQTVRRDMSVEIEGELEKTKEEEKIINRMNDAVDRFLYSYDLPTLTLSSNSIHIIKKDKLKEKAGEDYAGYIDYGNIFLHRHSDANEFIRTLAHEVSHEISYLQHQIYLKEKDINMQKKRIGFAVLKEARDMGRGFNEGMTEVVGGELRKAYASVIKLNSEKTIELTSVASYYPQIIVLEEIIELLKTDDPHAPDLFIKAFITGDKKIYKIISDKFKEKGIKDGLKILMDMGVEEEDALHTAEKLGLEKAKQRIEEIIKENK